MLDSHEQLPVVSATDRDLQTDLAPFAALRDAAMAMTCHVIFEAWDADRPATLSPVVIDNVIRQRIGFHGLLRSEEHTSELQSLMRISYAVFCLKKKTYISPISNSNPRN